MNYSLFIIDAGLIYGMFLLSYWIRYQGDIPKESFAPFQDSQIILVGITMLALTYSRVFQKRFRSYWMFFQKLVRGLVLATASCFVFMYLLRDKWSPFPSSVLLIHFILSVGGLFLVNGLILRLKHKIRKRVVVLGDETFYDPFMKKKSVVRIRHITKIEDLIHIRDIDEVMICQPLHENSNLNLLIFLLVQLHVEVTFGPMVYAELVAGKVEEESTVNLFSTFAGRRSDGQEFMMRLLDIGVSIVSLIVFSPLMCAIAILVKCSGPGPVIYKQQRVGKDRDLFMIYKFRTMTHDSEQLYGHKPATSDDDRITKIGKVLRRTRLDELPQLVNILKGHMSLVGPRPENISRVNTHRALRGLRLAVKPGLTGLAQIQSSYDLHPKHKIKYDFLYIQRRSFALNLYILARTVIVVLGQKGQ